MIAREASFRIRIDKFNTPGQWRKSAAFSVAGHLILVVAILFYPGFEQKKVLVTEKTYSVSLVSLPPPPPPKKKKRVVKKKKRPVVKKKKVVPKPAKKVLVPADKEVAPKEKKVKALPKKKEAPPPVPPAIEETIVEETALAHMETPETDYEYSGEYSESEPSPSMPSLEEGVYRDVAPVADQERSLDFKMDVKVVTDSLSHYLRSVKSKINRNWVTADVDLLAGKTLRVEVSFSLSDRGRLRDLSVLQPSGDALLDNSIIRALEESAPFPPFPEDFERGRIDIHLEFEYHKK